MGYCKSELTWSARTRCRLHLSARAQACLERTRSDPVQHFILLTSLSAQADLVCTSSRWGRAQTHAGAIGPDGCVLHSCVFVHVRDLLREKKVSAGARWSKSKDSLASSSRYKALSRDVREQLFRQFVSEQEVCTAWGAHAARFMVQKH